MNRVPYKQVVRAKRRAAGVPEPEVVRRHSWGFVITSYGVHAAKCGCGQYHPACAKAMCWCRTTKAPRVRAKIAVPMGRLRSFACAHVHCPGNRCRHR